MTNTATTTTCTCTTSTSDYCYCYSTTTTEATAELRCSDCLESMLHRGRYPYQSSRVLKQALTILRRYRVDNRPYISIWGMGPGGSGWNNATALARHIADYSRVFVRHINGLVLSLAGLSSSFSSLSSPSLLFVLFVICSFLLILSTLHANKFQDSFSPNNPAPLSRSPHRCRLSRQPDTHQTARFTCRQCWSGPFCKIAVFWIFCRSHVV